MIILDTNVFSEMMRPDMHPRVESWLNSTSQSVLWLTTITVYELLTGISLLPQGRKKRFLETEYHRLLEKYFKHHLLDFSEEAAQEAAKLNAERKKKGVNIDLRDTMIAGIALAHRATLATRNGRDFKDTGVKIVSPWE